MSEALKVYCPKDKKKVPIWYCLGSFFQSRAPCSHFAGEATVDFPENFVEIKCSFEEKKEKQNHE